MKEYLKKNGIRLAVVLALLVIAISVAAGTSSGRAGFLTNAVGAVREPVRKAAASLSDWLTGFAGYFGEYDALLEENSALRAELAQVQEEAQAYSDQVSENERLRQALGLSQRGSDYTLESAKIVTWNASNWESSFTISKGSSSGIEYGDCVITEYGSVVGTVTELGSSWATVTRWDTPWPMAAMPAMASPVHTTFTNPPEAPAACAMGFRVRGTCDTFPASPRARR